MTAALLTYTSSPTQVAISAGGSTSEVGITFLIVNKGPAPVSIEQIVLTIPQGDGSTDLIAANTAFTTGSVHSSNGSAWSLSPATNQAILMPVSAQGYASLAPKDTLQFTLSGLQINAVGAGQSATIAVLENAHDGGEGSAQIQIEKIAPGFYIESFALDQYNVAYGSPITVRWKVVNALSCTVTAEIIQVTPSRERNGPGCGVGTANPVCDGTISTGTDFSDSHTCNVEGATMFTLTALGTSANGDVTLSSQLLVTANEPAINFTGFPPVLSKGQDVTLKWVAADAGKLQLYSVPSQGQPSVLDLTATPVGSTTLQPLINTIYYLYAFTNKSDTQPTKQSEFEANVEQPQWTANLAASNVPSPAYPGETVTMNWAVANVDHCNLTCDQAAFTPQNNLPISGPRQVTLPDPGVANATATFTLTPVLFGTLGNFTPTSTTVPITNLPYFSKNLGAKPATVSGGPCTLTWALDHAEAAVLTSTLRGSTPQTVDPASGSLVVQVPSILVPTPIVYTLTTTRQNQRYTSSSSATVRTGDASALWCRSSLASGIGNDYLNTLYFDHANQRMRKVQINYAKNFGVSAILVWYSDGANADYSIIASPDVDSSVCLDIPAGDCLTTLDTWFYLGASDDDQYHWGTLWYIKLTTAGGRSAEIGSQPDQYHCEGPFRVSTSAGNQAIAFAWDMDSGYFGGIGLVSCADAYGQ